MHSRGECSSSIVEKNARRCTKLQLRSQLCRKSRDAVPIINSNFLFFFFFNRDLDSLCVLLSLEGVGNLLKKTPSAWKIDVKSYSEQKEV